ncbi:hypothetical protein DOTSEDRAFT_56017 [Dothistroma septosporum NZE10]|uniref:Uncharacterized protein n=1 Tax=Dothistroma septosporum (strain NZE10 / CBS 128990) TaxID=675120 RepID=N1PI03_DOTSN|nr:hypothetical protein DOTSEDRAFT_56017 [Dothistroma septosporum NZE10]
MSNHYPTFPDDLDFNDYFGNTQPISGFAEESNTHFIDPALLQLDAEQGSSAESGGQTGGSGDHVKSMHVQHGPEEAAAVDWDSWINILPGHDESTSGTNAASKVTASMNQDDAVSAARSTLFPNVNFDVDRSLPDPDAVRQSVQITGAAARSQMQNPFPSMHHIQNLDYAEDGHFSPAPWSNRLSALRTPQMQQTPGIAYNMVQNDPFGPPMPSIEAEHQQYGLHQQRFARRSTHGQHSPFQQAQNDPQYHARTVVNLAPQQSPGLSYPYSPEPEDTPDLDYSDARCRPEGKGKAREGSTPHENPRCIDCGKRYRLTKSEGRCSRCADKHIRRLAGQSPHIYVLDPSVPDIAAARQIVSPHIPGRNLSNDDYHRFAHQEDLWVARLLQAVNVIQSEASNGSVWALRQQTYLNEKASLEKGYADQHVTARLRALYQEIVNYHAGGPAVYAVGGDNAGYTDNRILSFSKRIHLICEIMASNKRVVMDVVEGRGVQGLVANPEVYNRRKQSNNNCNEEKKRIMEKGKEVEGVTPWPKTKKRRRTVASSELGFDLNEPVEAERAQAGPFDGLRRSPRLAEQLENALADMEGAGHDELGDDECLPVEGYSACKQYG